MTTDNIPGHTKLAPRYTSPWPTQAGTKRVLYEQAAAAKIVMRDETTGRLYERTAEAKPEETEREEWQEIGRRVGQAVALFAIVAAFVAVGAWAFVGATGR